MNKNCIVCDEEFISKKKTHILCGSITCAKKRKDELRNAKRVDVKECKICNTSFKPYRNSSVYCSSKCKSEQIRRTTQTKEYRQKKNSKRRVAKAKSNCVVCGKDIFGYSYRKYCSQYCINRRKTPKVKPTVKTCIVCNVNFTHGRKDKNICSAECKKIHVKEYKKKFNKNVKSNCVVCDKEFIKTTTAITCSKKCSSERALLRTREWFDTPMNKLTKRISSGIRKSLRKNSIPKKQNAFSYLTFNVHDLRRHLESQFTDGMSWDNMSEWHIDHIRPISSFSYTSTDCEDFKKCWALNNLQPLWAKDNISKNNKWDGVVNA